MKNLSNIQEYGVNSIECFQMLHKGADIWSMSWHFALVRARAFKFLHLIVVPKPWCWAKQGLYLKMIMASLYIKLSLGGPKGLLGSYWGLQQNWNI